MPCQLCTLLANLLNTQLMSVQLEHPANTGTGSLLVRSLLRALQRQQPLELLPCVPCNAGAFFATPESRATPSRSLTVSARRCAMTPMRFCVPTVCTYDAMHDNTRHCSGPNTATPARDTTQTKAMHYRELIQPRVLPSHVICHEYDIP